ncbi:MAG: ribbon-helix-helix protein, CopG family [Eubacterium sp.]|nr:ribbon-helix-helix protein, CopG family [Eubacterium sp.]
MAKRGRPKSDDPKAERITVRFTDEEYQLLKERADNNNQTIAQFIREAVKERLAQES